MNMPGFTAERAVDRSDAVYRRSGFPGAPAARVVPQGSCYRDCMATCDPDWYGWCKDECRVFCRPRPRPF